MPTPGAWIQPADQTAPLFGRHSWGQQIELTFPYGSSYPAYPTASATVTPVSGQAIWDLSLQNDVPDTSNTPDTWHLRLGESTLGIDVQWQIDNVATAIMPPVPPSSIPADAISWEYESTAGTPTGPVDLTALIFFQSFQDVADAISSPPPPTDVDLSSMRIYRFRDYTWTRSGIGDLFPKANPTSWITGAAASSLQLIANVPISDGAGTQPATPGSEPTTFWVGTPGSTQYSFATTINLTDLDANGSYVLAILPSLIINEATPTLPNAVDGAGNLAFVGLMAESLPAGDLFMAGVIHYRPPRYRFFYEEEQNLTGNMKDVRVHFWRPRVG
jgi:hypothetical protein